MNTHQSEKREEFGNPGFGSIAAKSPQFWDDSTLEYRKEIDWLAGASPFVECLRSIDSIFYTNLVTLVGRDSFDNLVDCVVHRRLHNKSFAIYGAGTFGLTVALLLTEAGATGTIYSSGSNPTAMRGALGILEPQGSSLEPYWLSSIPFYRNLITNGCPLREDQIRYYYSGVPDIDFFSQLIRTPGANPLVTHCSEFGCHKRLSFNGIIIAAPALCTLYTAALKLRGVHFVVREISEIVPAPDANITVASLGFGRGRGVSDVDIPGNAGQVLHLWGPRIVQLIEENQHLQECGSFGRPRPEGSVNIVLPSREDPYLLIGATKNPGSHQRLVQKNDYEFLMQGVSEMWTELFDAMVNESRSGYLEENCYRCIRPGSGKTPFTIRETNGCVDIFAAGGTGNSIAPGVALQALGLGLAIMETK